MKAITFLGAGNAYDTAYVLDDGREHVAPYFGAALAHFYSNLDMRVLVTPAAKERHFEFLRKRVEDDVASIEAVEIPIGATESELWTIFETVVDTVSEREDVLFDITHGFRSLPFLSFLAASYLRVIKQIDLVAVLYGNFEARDQSVSPHRAPVIDLTPFVALLDWMVAADRFIRFGDAQDLASQIRSAAPSSERLRTDKKARPINADLQSAAAAIEGISKALRLIRPVETMEASARLETVLLQATATIQNNAQPFFPLSRSVIDAYAGLGIPPEQMERDPTALLSRERSMVNWYINRKQYVQGIAVAREWIVSWAMLTIDFEQNLLDRNLRYLAERGLGYLEQELIHGRKPQNFDPPAIEDLVNVLRKQPQIESIVKTYQRIGDIRNDLLHAGKNLSAGKASKLEINIQKVGQWLDKIALPSPKDC